MKGLRRLSLPVNQYSPVYHLSRSVRCVSCQTPLVKDVDFVRRGFRCLVCWSRLCRSGLA